MMRVLRAMEVDEKGFTSPWSRDNVFHEAMRWKKKKEVWH